MVLGSPKTALQPRKILHVIPSVGYLRGGPSVVVQTLAWGLAKRGIETHIVTTDDNGPAERLKVPHGKPVIKEGVSYWYFCRQTRFYAFSWPLSAWLARHIREFDLVHIHALFSFASLPAAYYAHRHRVPYLVRPLGTLSKWGVRTRRPWLKKLSFRFIESRILKYAALVHYTSEQERLEAESFEIATPFAIVPNPLPERPTNIQAGRFRSQYPELQGRRIILFLSRLDKKKGLDLLLSAFAGIRKQVPNTALVVAGDGDREYVHWLKTHSTAQGIQSDLFWMGFLTGDDKWSALADADVFVLPSYSENFGVAVLEAMAAGMPVVISDQVGIHHEITAANAGLVTPMNISSLSEGVVQLLNNPTRARLLGLNGKRLTDQHYSAEAVTRQLIRIYNGIIN